MVTELKEKCFNCNEYSGQFYLSDKNWLCADCWQALIREKLPAKSVAKRLKKKWQN